MRGEKCVYGRFMEEQVQENVGCELVELHLADQRFSNCGVGTTCGAQEHLRTLYEHPMITFVEYFPMQRRSFSSSQSYSSKSTTSGAIKLLLVWKTFSGKLLKTPDSRSKIQPFVLVKTYLLTSASRQVYDRSGLDSRDVWLFLWMVQLKVRRLYLLSVFIYKYKHQCNALYSEVRPTSTYDRQTRAWQEPGQQSDRC